ncbi:MAG TPA: oxidoreductase [Candidatus Latescibacteria bacterium]|jgi:predicted dehydrogenase|nr:oxidoreductase [Candidatus Latescibacterota bacterium]
MKKRCLMVGAGGMARGWIRRFLPSFADRMEIVALVDIDPKVLAEQADFLGLPAEARFTDFKAAFRSVEADFCIVVTPPWVHRGPIEAACRRKMHVLTEKPIADSWADVRAIYRAVHKAKVKCTVIQNYRYDPGMYTFREILRSRRLGKLNYLMGRFLADYRRYAAWGAFRHEIPHSLLVEGGVHHLDMLRNLADSHCVQISGYEWNRPWSSFKGESNANYVMKMANGVIAHYEGSCSAAGQQNNWHQEYYRAECELGEVVVDRDGTVRLTTRDNKTGALTTAEVPTIQPEYVGHQYVIDAHLNWLAGGARPETALQDNIWSNAAMFGAIEASAKGATVDVAAMVSRVVGP